MANQQNALEIRSPSAAFHALEHELAELREEKDRDAAPSRIGGSLFAIGVSGWSLPRANRSQ
jgi:hypothetical protein